jgi:hypothetical protein
VTLDVDSIVNGYFLGFVLVLFAWSSTALLRIVLRLFGL